MTIIRVKRKLEEPQITSFIVSTESETVKRLKSDSIGIVYKLIDSSSAEQAPYFSSCNDNDIGLNGDLIGRLATKDNEDNIGQLNVPSKKRTSLPNRYTRKPTIDSRRMILSSKKLKEAKDRRFVIVSGRRETNNFVDAVTMDEFDDQAFQKFNNLKISNGAAAVKENIPEIFDYYQKTDDPLDIILETGLVATITLASSDLVAFHDDFVLVSDDVSSRGGESDDSNAEDWWGNEYPEESSSKESGAESDEGEEWEKAELESDYSY